MELRLQREREQAALQAQWEEEDRQRRLARQLEDMEMQYGKLGDVTAESLMEQVEEWAEAYGAEGAASKLVTDFADLVEDEMERMREAMVKMADTWLAAMKALSETGFSITLPPELTFQSPKLGLQKGLEELQSFLKAKPLSIFADGRAPSAGGSTVSRTETFSRSESRHQVSMSLPPNIDQVVARQLVGALRPALEGAAS